MCSAFCNYADIEAFTEEKKKSLLGKRQGKGADFVRAVEEIIDVYEKKQHLNAVRYDHEDSKPNNGHLEGSRSKLSTKSPEISPSASDNNQSEALFVSTENHNVMTVEEVPRSCVDGDSGNASTLNNEPSEKVSMLDQLRQTPLFTTTTTRKRQRDGPLPGSVIDRVPSFRRSRSSSAADPSKLQKSSETGSSAILAASDLVSDVLHEESTSKKMLTGDAANPPSGCNGDFPVSAGFPSNDCSEDIVSERSVVKSDAEESSVLESSCKLEKSVNGHLDKDLVLNEVDTLNGKLGLPVKAAIVKKKRKPNRKRAANFLECATLDKELDLQVELQENLSGFPNSCKESVEYFSKADGDEHLPLVKRARVRMGKPSMQETQLGEVVEKREKPESIATLKESDRCIKSSSPVSSSAERAPYRTKEVANSSLVNDDCALPAGRDTMLWKVTKFQLKGITLDVEAALPPSKRLHRALEAMSANAAESTDDTAEAPCEVEAICKGCTISSDENPGDHPIDGNVESPVMEVTCRSITNCPKENPNDQPVDGNVERPEMEVFCNCTSNSSKDNLDNQPVDGDVHSPVRSQCMQSSISTASQIRTFGLSSSLALEDPDASLLTPSKVEPGNIPTQNLNNTENKECKEILVGLEDCDGASTCEISDINSQEKVIQPCTVKTIEKQVGSASSEVVPDQLSPPAVDEDENENLHASNDCSYPPEEGVKESGKLMPAVLQKPISVMDSKTVDEILDTNQSLMTLPTKAVVLVASNTSGPVKSPSSPPDESIPAIDM